MPAAQSQSKRVQDPPILSVSLSLWVSEKPKPKLWRSRVSLSMPILSTLINSTPFNTKWKCILSIPLNNSSSSSCSHSTPAMPAASSPSRCTTASPSPSRTGHSPPECSLRHTTGRRRAPSSTTPNSPTVIASSTAASSPIPKPPSLSPTATPPSASTPSDCTFFFHACLLYIILFPN